ncbi:MAG: L,D-transpeptidase [Clostridia bacterium]|nr:L,D-transpeptidase [Clostridia bacterium]
MPEIKHADEAQVKKIKKRNTLIAVAAAVIVIAVLATVVTVKAVAKKKAAAAAKTTKAPVTTEATTEPTTEAETEESTTEETTTATPTTTAAPATTTAAPAANTASVDSSGKVTFVTSADYAASHRYCVGVNRQMHTVTVYGKDDSNNYTKPVIAFACSCGKPGHETPAGTFFAGANTRTDWKYTWLTMVDSSYGQYTTQITGAIWFHSVCYTQNGNKGTLEYEEYNKLGGPASLGCVRLCVRDAKWVYENVSDRGTLVFIYDSSVPGPLGKPEAPRVDVNSPNRGWDPTDPDPANPWKTS